MSNLGTTPGNVPGLGEKLCGAATMIARFLAMSLKRRAPHSPETEGRRGDAFDLNLLFYLPSPLSLLPATNDSRGV
jgi:hypothetical protein